MAQSKFYLETRALTEGAIMAAMTAILAMINLYIPVLGLLVALIWTLPVVSVCVRHGMRAGILTMTAAGFIIMIVSSPVSALTLIIPCAASALLLGNALRKSWSTGQTLVTTAATTFVSMLAALLVTFLISGISPWDQWLSLKATLEQSLEMVMPLYENSGMLRQMGVTAAQFAEQWQLALSLLELLLPAIMVVSSVCTAFVNYILAHKVLSKLKVTLPAMVPFGNWRLPWWNIWGFILAFALAFLGGRFLPELPWLSNMGMNLLVFYVPIFVASGLTVAAFYIQKVPKERRLVYKVVLIGGFFLLMNGFILVMGAIGLFDTVFDYRHLEKAKADSKEK